MGNSPPAIMSVSVDQSQLQPPGPATFQVGQQSVADVTMIDTDLADTLTVRWFVDYSADNPVNFSASGTAPPSGFATRTATVQLQALCTQALAKSNSGEHDLTIVVFDHPLVDQVIVSNPGMPPWQQMSPPGFSATMFFHLVCFGSGA